MSHTNSTANLSLPQFIGTDKPTWLSDVNGAFAAIDAYAGSNDAALAIVDGKADTAIGDASSAVTTAGNAATTAGNAAATATNANTIAGNALTVANGINSKVGVLTDLTTTDKSTVVNAINEVNGKDAADIPYDNTGSGLTATDVQAAIDEVAQGGGGGSTLPVVWDNPNDSVIQSPGTVATIADQPDYQAYLVIIKQNAGSGTSTYTSVAVLPGLPALVSVCGRLGIELREITVSYNAGTVTLTAGQGYSGSYGSVSAEDNACIIKRVYGLS